MTCKQRVYGEDGYEPITRHRHSAAVMDIILEFLGVFAPVLDIVVKEASETIRRGSPPPPITSSVLRRLARESGMEWFSSDADQDEAGFKWYDATSFPIRSRLLGGRTGIVVAKSGKAGKTIHKMYLVIGDKYYSLPVTSTWNHASVFTTAVPLIHLLEQGPGALPSRVEKLLSRQGGIPAVLYSFRRGYLFGGRIVNISGRPVAANNMLVFLKGLITARKEKRVLPELKGLVIGSRDFPLPFVVKPVTGYHVMIPVPLVVNGVWERRKTEA